MQPQLFHIPQFCKSNYRASVRQGGNFTVKSDHLRVQTILSIRLRILTGTSEVRQYFKAKMVQAAERAFCGDHSLQTTALPPRQTSKPDCRVFICGSLLKWQRRRCIYVHFTFLCSGRSIRTALRQRSCCGKGQRRHHQIPNPLTVHNILAGLAKAVGFDIKAPTVPAEQGISETEVAAVVSSTL